MAEQPLFFLRGKSTKVNCCFFYCFSSDIYASVCPFKSISSSLLSIYLSIAVSVCVSISVLAIFLVSMSQSFYSSSPLLPISLSLPLPCNIYNSLSLYFLLPSMLVLSALSLYLTLKDPFSLFLSITLSLSL